MNTAWGVETFDKKLKVWNLCMICATRSQARFIAKFETRPISGGNKVRVVAFDRREK